MAQAQPRRFRETGKLERALPFVCTPKGTRSIAKTEWGLQQCLRLRVVGIIFIARPCSGSARKASAAFAATVRDVFERWLQRSQTTSSHIKGDQRKFFFGELQSLCKLHHESAKKREEARGYSTQIGADSTLGITYIRGAGGA